MLTSEPLARMMWYSMRSISNRVTYVKGTTTTLQ